MKENFTRPRNIETIDGIDKRSFPTSIWPDYADTFTAMYFTADAIEDSLFTNSPGDVFERENHNFREDRNKISEHKGLYNHGVYEFSQHRKVY